MTDREKSEVRRRSTIADVAALAGVDRSVVSRLINDDPKLSIRDVTRQRVLNAIEMLGYRPNAAARSLRTARTRTLGLFMPDFVNPVYAEIIKGAEQAAAAAGCLLVTGSVDSTGTTAQTYLDLLGHGRVDGLLLAAGGLRVSDETELSRLGLPFLFTNQTGPSRRRYVILDDVRAAGLAVEHLAELGHTRIAHIAGPNTTFSARRRRQGYLKAIRRLGLPELIVSGEYRPEGGARAMTELLGEPEPPTAVLVGNVASAIGALHAAHRLDTRVPKDISVVAVQDLTWAAHLVPPLTTVRMPLQRMGERAVELLLERPAEADVREVIKEPIELVLRESTAPA